MRIHNGPTVQITQGAYYILENKHWIPLLAPNTPYTPFLVDTGQRRPKWVHYDSKMAMLVPTIDRIPKQAATPTNGCATFDYITVAYLNDKNTVVPTYIYADQHSIFCAAFGGVTLPRPHPNLPIHKAYASSIIRKLINSGCWLK